MNFASLGLPSRAARRAGIQFLHANVSEGCLSQIYQWRAPLCVCGFLLYFMDKPSVRVCVWTLLYPLQRSPVANLWIISVLEDEDG